MNITNIISIVCPAVCLLMFFYFKGYIKRRTSASGMTEEHRSEVIKLMADIDRITDRDSQLIEDRVKKLKELLEETDNRIAAYKKELESRPVPPPNKRPVEAAYFENDDKSRQGEALLYTSLGRGIRAALKTPTPEPAPVLELTLPFEAATAPEPRRDISPKPVSKRQIRASIDLLANEGFPPEEIASRLEISLAEVNLAMNLRRPKRQLEKH
jgi:hypothetical protein